MTTFWNRVSRAFKIGRSRYYIGRDLNHNGYYEYPALDGSSDPRRTRRLVQYHEHKELGEHDQNSLPIQWLMWLRHTRKSAPTIEELEQDQERIRITKHNARVLEYREAERRRLLEQKAKEQSTQFKIEAEPPSESWVPTPKSRGGSRATPVPTAHVTDRGAEQEKDERILREEHPSPDTVIQERKVDMDVWEASRRRLEEQSLSSSQRSGTDFQEAQNRRSSRKAELKQKEFERERARKFMSRSPLDAFDVDFSDQTTSREKR